MNKLQELIAEMSQGNPGALSVLCKIAETLGPLSGAVVQQLKIEEIFGPDLWIGFKDVHKQDIKAFIKATANGAIKEQIAESKAAEQKMIDEAMAKQRAEG